MQDLPFEFETDWQYTAGASKRIRAIYKADHELDRVQIISLQYYHFDASDLPRWIRMDGLLEEICAEWLKLNREADMLKCAKWDARMRADLAERDAENAAARD